MMRRGKCWKIGLVSFIVGGLVLAGTQRLEADDSRVAVPGSQRIDDLALTRDWQFHIEGEVVHDALIHYSNYHVAWLVQAPEVGALLISPRGHSVQRVNPDGVVESSEGATLEASSTIGWIGRFEMRRGGGRHFEFDELAMALIPAPPLLGRQSLPTVEDRHPTFTAEAATYRSKMATVSFLRAGKSNQGNDLTVRVYFGSWSPICARIVPKILAVEDAWEGRGVRFEYYGLPKPITDDPHAVEKRITGVPTVVVLDGDEELDRLTGRQLDDPAAALARSLEAP